IHEESDKFVITADLPGLTSDDIEIFVEHDRVTIKGERKLERRVEDKDFGRFERVEGSFQRSFKLPDNADLDQVSASNRDGVLEIVIKKQETIASRRIKVES
ncbi:MAG: Hsp20/alpha crystallin family protein, partial [Gammaproteobacteria bacterium]|nr:Hsp20/alpha crystallin family protein [Gammaproteobacteria bacterium]